MILHYFSTACHGLFRQHPLVYSGRLYGKTHMGGGPLGRAYVRYRTDSSGASGGRIVPYLLSPTRCRLGS